MATQDVEQLPASDRLDLHTERLGPLPLINHFIDRLQIDGTLDRFVPTTDRRTGLPAAKALGVLLRSILVEREPIYRQQEVVRSFDPRAFGLGSADVEHVGDDAIGRALDRLFDADRGALLTEVVVATVEKFGLTFEEFHNDSTSIRFCGQYSAASGRSIRGKPAPFITYGYSKDHRPDLKQLLFILTTCADGGVPVQFRSAAGNFSDSRTHEETWEALCKVAGKKNFLYVADSKLCGEEAMDFIDRQGGRFVTVMPRSRLEDREFRKWIQTEEPKWETVRNRRHPRRRDGPRDIWRVYRYHIPSKEGWPTIWVSSSLLALRQGQTRREVVARTEQELARLSRQLNRKRPRTRSRVKVEKAVEEILGRANVSRYVKVKIVRVDEHTYRQERPGRPGPDTRYTRSTKKRWRIEWTVDEKAIAYDKKSDGMYPLLTNDRGLTPEQVLEAHKRQPTIEKRFQQTKTVFEIAPVLLKNEGRIEALFFLYTLALLVQALIERELRRRMKTLGMPELPLYPEERMTRRPTGEQVFRLFSLTARHTLRAGSNVVRVFEPELTELQKLVLGVMGIQAPIYRSA